MAERPQLILDFHQVLCSRHGEPLRSQWPLGYATMCMKLIDVVLAQPEFTALSLGDIGSRLNKKPLCCRVADDILISAYSEAGIGKMGVCENCKEEHLGTSFKLSNGRGGIDEFKHICFGCVIHQLRPRNAN